MGRLIPAGTGFAYHTERWGRERVAADLFDSGVRAHVDTEVEEENIDQN